MIRHPYNRVPRRSRRTYVNRTIGRYQHRVGYYNPTLMQAAGMGVSNRTYRLGIARARARLPKEIQANINSYL